MKIALPALILCLCAVACIDADGFQDGTRPPERGLLVPPSVTPIPTYAPPPTITPLPQFQSAPAYAPPPTITPLPQFQPPPTITPIPKRGGSGSPEPLRQIGVERAFPSLSFDEPVALAFPDDGANVGFVVEKRGRVFALIADDDAELFLDIRDRVRDRGNEEGLLSLAFDPDFASNRHFYVYYTASDPRRSVISRFTALPDDPTRADHDSEKLILEVEQPYSNHNGGQILFGPDGFLYVGLGDGGSAGDPKINGQNLGTLLGAMLRLDVSALDSTGAYAIPPDNPFVGVEGARPEIWAYGLRNPWRFTFDRETGDLWAADVGQNAFEEIDLIRPGLNYGWSVMEGEECFSRSRHPCDTGGLEPPIAVYGRDGGCSVTGGYVYRGSRLPALYGAYAYADFCSGKIWALRYDGQRVTESLRIADTQLNISSFAEDPNGELYILDLDGGIYAFTG